MKSYRKKGAIKAVKFVRKEYDALVAEPKKLEKCTDDLKLLLKRIKKTQQGYFCASSAGMRPITDGSWICLDQGRVFTMSDENFVGKFEETLEVPGSSTQVEELTKKIQSLEAEVAERTKALEQADKEFDELKANFDKLNASIDQAQTAAKEPTA